MAESNKGVLKIQLSELLDMDSGIVLHQTLKSYLIQRYKNTIFLNLKPQMGGFIDEGSISISVLSSQKVDASFLLKCSVFYEEKIGGCNCNDEPHSENGYCEYSIELNADSLVFSDYP